MQKKTGMFILMLALALVASAFAGCSRSAYLFPNNTGLYRGATTGTTTGYGATNTGYGATNTGYGATDSGMTNSGNGMTTPQTATRLSSTMPNDLPPVGNTDGNMTRGLNNTNQTSLIATQIRAANLEGVSNMTVLDRNQIQSKLSLNPDILEDYYMLDSTNNVGSVLYVAKVKNDSDKQVVRDAFNRRLSALNDATLATMPDKLAISRSGRIIENGRYLMLVASDRQDTMVNSLNSMFR